MLAEEENFVSLARINRELFLSHCRPPIPRWAAGYCTAI
jgi:hypothetical protein